jgi:hypothetical protein
MVSTRSTRSSTKHEAPKPDTEAPAKKQKTTKGTKKEEENAKSEEQPDTEMTSEEVTIIPQSTLTCRNHNMLKMGKRWPIMRKKPMENPQPLNLKLQKPKSKPQAEQNETLKNQGTIR